MNQVSLRPVSKISDHGYPEDVLTEQIVPGGLEYRVQKIIFKLKRKKDFLTPKAEISFGIARKRDFEFISKETPKSLRFETMAEMECFLFNYVRLMVVHGRKIGKITPKNFEYKMSKALKTIESIWRMNLE